MSWPKRVQSETFIFAVLLGSIAILLPIYLSRTSSTPPPAPSNVVSQPAVALPLATPLLAETTPARQPPIAIILPYLSWIPSLAFHIPKRFLSIASKPLFYLLGILYQVFAPVFITLQILFVVLVQTPWRLFTLALEIMYPIYLLCSVGVIAGLLMGGGAVGILQGGKFLANSYVLDTMKGES
jgi:hypothetical protein